MWRWLRDGRRERDRGVQTAGWEGEWRTAVQTLAGEVAVTRWRRIRGRLVVEAADEHEVRIVRREWAKAGWLRHEGLPPCTVYDWHRGVPG